jgi:hypothetical protein
MNCVEGAFQAKHAARQSAGEAKGRWVRLTSEDSLAKIANVERDIFRRQTDMMTEHRSGARASAAALTSRKAPDARRSPYVELTPCLEFIALERCVERCVEFSKCATQKNPLGYDITPESRASHAQFATA